MNILIPMAGLGIRFASSHPNQLKPLIKVNGKPMIERVLSNLNLSSHKNARLIIVTSTTIGINTEFKAIMDLFCTDYEIILHDEITQGPACTCLLAKAFINNNNPLIIINCDQIIVDFDIQNLLNFVKLSNADGVIGTFHSNSKKNSYVKLSGNLDIEEVKEKIVISNIATNGVHFWTKGRDFVESAEEMIARGEKYSNEYYVAPSYNYMIQKGKKILPYYYNLHFPIGTPEDLKYFEENVYGCV